MLSITPVAASDRTAITARRLLSELVYELLDAHADTQRMAEQLESGDAWAPELDDAWRAHLDYLRGLQRVGRETLAALELRC